MNISFFLLYVSGKCSTQLGSCGLCKNFKPVRPCPFSSHAEVTDWGKQMGSSRFFPVIYSLYMQTREYFEKSIGATWVFLVHKSPIKFSNGRTFYLLRDFRKTFSNHERSRNRASLGHWGDWPGAPHARMIQGVWEGSRRWLCHLMPKIVGDIGNCVISPWVIPKARWVVLSLLPWHIPLGLFVVLTYFKAVWGSFQPHFKLIKMLWLQDMERREGGVHTLSQGWNTLPLNHL